MMDVKKILDEWMNLVHKQQRITNHMKRKLDRLIGTKTRFAVSDHMNPTMCEIVDTKHDGESVKIRNLRTSNVYWIYAGYLKPN